MFATGTNRYPVALFKLYLEKRPVQLQKSGPFYLSTITNPVTNVWYKVTPMGVHKINTLMKTMVENSPLADTSSILTNHTARKTVVKKLKQHQVPKCDIIVITGHNNERGLDPYDSGDEQQQQTLSNCTDNFSKKDQMELDCNCAVPMTLVDKPCFDFKRSR